MPEILGDFDSLEFNDTQREFVINATASYVAQLSRSGFTEKDKVLGMYDVLDEINGERIAKSKDKPSCKKGCAHCCHIRVAATEMEANVVIDYMNHNDMNFNEEEVERLKKQAAISDDLEYMLSPHRRCVFLGEGNLCKIYDVRPSACRNYYVYNDPKDCDTYNTQHIDGKTLVDFDLNTIPPILALMQLSDMQTFSKHIVNKLKNLIS